MDRVELLSGPEVIDALLAEAGCPRCVARFESGEGPGSGWCAGCQTYIEAALCIQRLWGLLGRAHVMTRDDPHAAAFQLHLDIAEALGKGKT